MINPKLLTKSRYVNGLQCAKWLWLSFNKPEELPKVDELAQHRFDEGAKVGELAKSLFPEGISVKSQLNKEENHRESKELLKKRKPLFEAGFMHKNGKCYARADILIPVGKDEWAIYEIKSATDVKKEYIWDVAFQKYCYESAGLKISQCYILHINNQYVRQGEIEVNELFVTAPIHEEVAEEIKNIDSKIKKLFEITSLKTCPEFKKGEECHEDDLNVHTNDKFWKEHPECNILDLYYGGKKARELFDKGILYIKDMDENHFTTGPQKKQQKIQYKTTKNGEHHADKEELAKFIKGLKYPIYFMDFESYQTAIPLYNNSKPYQHLPFQFSVHVIKKQGDTPKHYSFIASGSKDPRLNFAQELRSVIGEYGTVLVYYQSFEKSRLKEIAEFFPDESNWIESVIKRFVDLYEPFRNFAYYHPSQDGSASLKKVLPALTGKGYDDLEIGDGMTASIAYLFITHGAYNGDKPTSKDIKNVRANLEKYCGQDTEGMIWILEKLEELIK